MDCEQRENTDVLFSYFFETYKKIHYKIREMKNTTIFMNLILLISIKQKN